jgi:hypothetical protein
MSTRVFAALILAAFVRTPAWAAGDATPAAGGMAEPPSPAPQEPPPPPQSSYPPPPPHTQPLEPAQVTAGAPTAPPQAAAPHGQWVYTKQYGWVWMSYDDGYTQVVPDAALAYQYVFYPAFGWRWVVAPWVLGFGVAPYWGHLGPTHFHWYAHPRFVAPRPYRGPGWGHVSAGHAMGRGGGHGHR